MTTAAPPANDAAATCQRLRDQLALYRFKTDVDTLTCSLSG